MKKISMILLVLAMGVAAMANDTSKVAFEAKHIRMGLRVLLDSVKVSYAGAAGSWTAACYAQDKEIFINYEKSAEEIERFIRALNPFILSSTTFRGNMMKIMKAEIASDAFCVPHPAGTVSKIEDDKFFIATSKGLIVPTVMQFGSFFIGDSRDFIRIVNPKIGEEFK